VAEDYVHRIGRTGRAGNEGEALSLVCVDEDRLLRDIEKLIGFKVQSEVIEGYEPDPSIQPEPIQKGRGQRQQKTGRSARSDSRGGPQKGRGRNPGSNPSRNNAAGKRQAERKAAPRSVERDENGDVNGNTLSADNSNRDPVVLAGGDQIARRKRGGKGKPGAGNKGGHEKRSAKTGNGRNKQRRSGQGGKRRSSPSLLGG